MHVWAWARAVAAAAPSFDFGLVSETCTPQEAKQPKRRSGPVIRPRIDALIWVCGDAKSRLCPRADFACGFRGLPFRLSFAVERLLRIGPAERSGRLVGGKRRNRRGDLGGRVALRVQIMGGEPVHDSQ